MRLYPWHFLILIIRYLEPNLKVDRARRDNDPGNLKMSAPMKRT